MLFYQKFFSVFILLLILILEPAFSKEEHGRTFYLYPVSESIITGPLPIKKPNDGLRDLLNSKGVSCIILDSQDLDAELNSKTKENKFLITMETEDPGGGYPCKLTVYKLADYFPDSDNKDNILGIIEWTNPASDNSNIIKEQTDSIALKIYNSVPDVVEESPSPLPGDSENTDSPDSGGTIIYTDPTPADTVPTGKTDISSAPSSSGRGVSFGGLFLAFIALGVAIASFVVNIQTRGKVQKINDRDAFSELRNTISKKDIAPGFEAIKEKLSEKAGKDAIRELENKMKKISSDLSSKIDKELKENISRFDLEINILKSDMEKIDRAVARISINPQIKLFVSGLKSFSDQILAVYHEKDDGMTERLKYVNTARNIDNALACWTKESAGIITRLKISFKNNATPPEQNILKFARDLIHKSEGYSNSLQRILEKYGNKSDFQIPEFEEYCFQFLQDRKKLSSVIEERDGLYNELVLGYSRLAAREITENLGSALNSDNMKQENSEFIEVVKKWILSDLLLLCDYMDSFYNDLDKSKTELSLDFYRGLVNLIKSFDNFLEKIEIEYMKIRLKEDTFSSEFHNITRRMGDGQKIVKVEQEGVKWKGEILRKASVWVG